MKSLSCDDVLAPEAFGIGSETSLRPVFAGNRWSQHVSFGSRRSGPDIEYVGTSALIVASLPAHLPS